VDGHRPAPVAVGLPVVAVAVALITWIMLNGVNPIHFGTPAHRVPRVTRE
jgi:hypothetical protein